MERRKASTTPGESYVRGANSNIEIIREPLM
jgi:hypothetical protein